MDSTSIALSGLHSASERLDKVAQKIASPSAVSQGLSDAASAQDSIDISQAAIEMLLARTEFAVNVKLLKAQDEQTRHALDLIA
ncbi:MAG TPA: hypothetical protein VEF04_04990 [Blastocatellia bacterium]|nr:hypothetical protein [Blastocatellia bacterium]